MEACTRRIREHIKDIKLGPAMINFTFESFMASPILLPFLFYFLVIIIHTPTDENGIYYYLESFY